MLLAFGREKGSRPCCMESANIRDCEDSIHKIVDRLWFRVLLQTIKSILCCRDGRDGRLIFPKQESDYQIKAEILSVPFAEKPIRVFTRTRDLV